MSIADLMGGSQSAQHDLGVPNPNAPDPLLSAAYGLNDSQLADVLNGKPLSIMVAGKLTAITPAMAMMAAMGKKELRTAVEGKLAQQQLAQQQSIKDKMLADLQNPQGLPPQGIPQAAQAPQAAPQGPAMEQGVAALPADNMKSMAGGGIVAFGDPKLNPNEDQVVELSDEEKQALQDNPYLQRSRAVANFFAPLGEGKNWDPVRKLAEVGGSVRKGWENFITQSPEDQYKSWNKSKELRQGVVKQDGTLTPKGKLVKEGLVDPDTPITKLKETADKTVKNRLADTAAFTDMTGYTKPNSDTGSGPGAGDPGAGNPGAGGPGAGGPGAGGANRYAAPTRQNPFGRFQDMEINEDKVKEQGLGGAYMAIAQALLGNPTLARAGAAALPNVMQQAMSTNKEVRDLQKEKRAYDFNVAKANEAFAQHQDQLGFEYLKQADTHDYQMKHLNVLGQNNPMAMVAAIRKENPGMSMTDAIAALNSAKNDYRTDLALQNKFADWKKSTAGMLEPNITFDEWKKKMGYDTGGGGSQYSTVIPA